MPDCPVVATQTGKVKGQVCVKGKPDGGNDVFYYAGIPFAKPPLGDLRFEPPQKCESWEGILNTTKVKPCPMQDETLARKLDRNMTLPNEFNDNYKEMNEDCLYINVYTPDTSNTASMPVLFWIHGGGFQLGGTGGYSGQALCSLHDVVLVVAAYRANIFGYLTTGKDTKYPGNMGMKDLLLALEWTRDNIRNFGGNPNNVTIFGESAGAMAVSCLMLSPLSKGLFHKSIQHSGTADFPMLIREDYGEILKQYLEELEIKETEPEAIVKKLKSLDARFLIEESRELFYKSILFGVYVDGNFLPENTRKMIQEGRLASVPSIVGCNNSENAGILAFGYPPEFATGFSKEEFSQMSKASLPMIVASRADAKKLEVACAKVEEFYSKEYSDDDKYKWSKVIASIQSDFSYTVPTLELALAHSKKGNPTYLYHMTQQLKCHHDERFQGRVELKPEFCECDHADDINFTFGFPLMENVLEKNVKFTEEEKQMSKEWMTYIANFATYGNPNIGNPVKCEWPRFDDEKQRYLNARSEFVDESFLAPERFKLWTKTLPSL